MYRDFITVSEAIPLGGLRVAFSRGLPGAWGQAIREVLDLKGIEYHPVIQEPGASNEDLQRWTGQNSAPCAILDDERPRSHWSELLMLAERLAPEPRLVPLHEHERMEMFGILHELCGEDGFGWSSRLVIFDIRKSEGSGEVSGDMLRKYQNGDLPDHPARRIVAIMKALAERLERQTAANSAYFVGSGLSAADIYWTAFSNLVAPMRHEDCPMPDYYRRWTEACCKATGTNVPEILLAHRERILHDHLKPPLWF